jgi:hypothetical protein
VLFSPISASAAESFRVPILLYHRFGATVADGMTITTPVFEAQMKYLHDNGYKVIPLRQLIDHYRGKAPAPGPKSVVIVEDDAHKSVYSDMLPIIKKYRYPVTIFTYPSAISNAKYAMTWDQLRELTKTGLFDWSRASIKFQKGVNSVQLPLIRLYVSIEKVESPTGNGARL